MTESEKKDKISVKVKAFTPRCDMIEFQKNLSYSDLNAVYGSLLTEKQREFLELYYDCDVSLNEIAEQYGISRQAVRDAIVRGEKVLSEFEAKLGLLKRRAETADKLNKAVELIDSDNQKSAKEILTSLIEEE